MGGEFVMWAEPLRWLPTYNDYPPLVNLLVKARKLMVAFPNVRLNIVLVRMKSSLMPYFLSLWTKPLVYKVFMPPKRDQQRLKGNGGDVEQHPESIATAGKSRSAQGSLHYT
jgi:hypothetical protein